MPSLTSGLPPGTWPRAGRRRLSLALVLALGLVPLLGGAWEPAAGAAPGPASPAGPPIRGRSVDAGPATLAASGVAAPGPAAQRRAIADFVEAAYRLPAKDTLGDMAKVMPPDEALLAIQGMSDGDVARIYGALPIIRHWASVQRRLAAGPTAGPPPAPADTTDPEQLRRDLDAVFVARARWEPWVGAGDPAYAQRLLDGRNLLRNATTEDLVKLGDALAWIPDWRQTLAPDLPAILGPIGPISAARPAAGLGPEVTDEQCTEADLQRDPLPLIIASAALRGTSLIEDFVANFFTKDIKVCTGLLGITVCVDVPNPVFFILKTLQLASNRAVDGLDAASLLLGVCQSIVHWRLTVVHRDTFLVNAQGIMKSLIEQNNTLVDRTQTIDFAKREIWKLDLELAIEENLLEPAPLPDGSNENRISLFQLTDTVCFNPDQLLPTPAPALPTPVLTAPKPTAAPPPALDPLPTVRAPVPVPDRREQCGLELVKRLVGEAILLNQMAGNEVHEAPVIYAAANADLAARRFAQAYLRYRQAYRAAVQPAAEPRSASSGTVDR